jgi:hypothetical protein
VEKLRRRRRDCTLPLLQCGTNPDSKITRLPRQPTTARHAGRRTHAQARLRCRYQLRGTGLRFMERGKRGFFCSCGRPDRAISSKRTSTLYSLISHFSFRGQFETDRNEDPFRRPYGRRWTRRHLRPDCDRVPDADFRADETRPESHRARSLGIHGRSARAPR